MNIDLKLLKYHLKSELWWKVGKNSGLRNVNFTICYSNSSNTINPALQWSWKLPLTRVCGQAVGAGKHHTVPFYFKYFCCHKTVF